MQYSDSTNNSGIVEDIDFLANTDSVTYPIKEKTRNANRALDRVAYLIQMSDQNWQWDDENNTDLPIATSNIVSGQSDYGLDTTFLKILKVEIKDTTGIWRELRPIDINTPSFFQESTASTQGFPTSYDKFANSIFLFPTPNFSQSSSLRVYFQRNINYFATTDTTKTPGFNPQFHRLVSLHAAIDKSIAKDLPQTKNLQFKIDLMESDLQSYYSNRPKDEPMNLRSLNRSSQ